MKTYVLVVRDDGTVEISESGSMVKLSYVTMRERDEWKKKYEDLLKSNPQVEELNRSIHILNNIMGHPDSLVTSLQADNERLTRDNDSWKARFHGLERDMEGTMVTLEGWQKKYEEANGEAQKWREKFHRLDEDSHDEIYRLKETLKKIHESLMDAAVAVRT